MSDYVKAWQCIGCGRIDAPVMYLDGPDYEKYVAAVFKRETQLIERLKLRELMAKG